MVATAPPLDCGGSNCGFYQDQMEESGEDYHAMKELPSGKRPYTIQRRGGIQRKEKSNSSEHTWDFTSTRARGRAELYTRITKTGYIFYSEAGEKYMKIF